MFVLLLLAAFPFAPHPARAQGSSEKPVRLAPGIPPERAEANLVLVDVLVRDKSGKPVRGLTQADFDLLIDRLPANISSFEDYCAQPAPAPASGEGRAPAPPPPPPPDNVLGTSRNPELHHIVLFFDINHLTKPGKERSIDAALKFLREQMTDSDRVMLLAMKGKPILLEPFTSDRARLEARLLEVRGDDTMFDMSVAEDRLNMLDILRASARVSTATAYALAEENKARRSIEAIKSMMPALAAIRGRKTIVHFAETLKDEPGLHYLLLAGTTPAREHIDIKGAMIDLTRAANAAGVSFYTVFAAGLGEGSGTSFGDASIGRIGGPDATAMQAAGGAAEDGALGFGTTIALETGGVPLRRSNDLSKIFTSVEDDISCYYVLGYTNPGPGDDKRHSIIVKARTKGYDVRNRPYFEDWSEAHRLDWKFQSALLAPAFYKEIGVKVEAFALAPRVKDVPVLVKAEFPLSEVTLESREGGRRAGEVEVRGTIYSGNKEVKTFSRRFPVALEPGEEIGDRKIIYEAGTELPPGTYDLTVAVLDGVSWELGSAESQVPVRGRSTGISGDAILWTSSAGDVLMAADAAGVGILDSGSGHGFVPRSERRFGPRDAGVLYTVVCPASGGSASRGAGPGDAGPPKVLRTIFSGDQAVATFPPVALGGAAAAAKAAAAATPRKRELEDALKVPDDACEGIFASITPGRLGPGEYVYEVRVEGMGPQTVTHRAAFLVDDGGAVEDAGQNGN